MLGAPFRVAPVGARRAADSPGWKACISQLAWQPALAAGTNRAESKGARSMQRSQAYGQVLYFSCLWCTIRTPRNAFMPGRTSEQCVCFGPAGAHRTSDGAGVFAVLGPAMRDVV